MCSLKLRAVSSYMPCLGSGAFGGSSSLSGSWRANTCRHERTQIINPLENGIDTHWRFRLERLEHPCFQRLQVSGTLVFHCFLIWLKQQKPVEKNKHIYYENTVISKRTLAKELIILPDLWTQKHNVVKTVILSIIFYDYKLSQKHPRQSWGLHFN